MPQSRLNICIHCHFYQPPRENPWLEEIELQESAAPYHDWNERISAECYRPNGLSRILDQEGWVTSLTNNYARVSFNFGPTLLSWMEINDPLAYEAILEGDRQSVERYKGHGSAIAQAYNHMIMPLANRRDKETQILWGLRDFERRFGREAEAMWLPETAVDIETLEILAAHGMKYVILAPRQAKAARPIVAPTASAPMPWVEMGGEKIDPKRAYLCHLPSGENIALFFYDGPISKAVAFEGLLHNGEKFANRLMEGFNTGDNRAQLMHIGTDGESYGHHHRNGDMALAYAFDYIQRQSRVATVNYGLFLEEHPPEWEVQIFENSSWSCTHGIERWRSDCGCNSGMRPQWHQAWRGPFREALDFLRERLEKPYEQAMRAFTNDPWGMRNDYINVILDRGDASRSAFFDKWLSVPLATHETPLLKLLEMQRNLLLSYTSCGWFFDEVSGLETVQNLQYAARVIELARETLELDLEEEFLERLERAPSNILEVKNGRAVYERFVKPAIVDFQKIGAHLGVEAIFTDRRRLGTFYSYDFEMIEYRQEISGKARLICGHVEITSRITREMQAVDFCVLYTGNHDINVGVRPHTDKAAFESIGRDLMPPFAHGDLSKALRLLDRHFAGNLYSLKDLFRDQQKKIINVLFSQTLDRVSDQFLNIYDQHYPLMSYLSDIQITLPPVFSHIANYIQNSHIEFELEKPDNINSDEIARYIREARNWGVVLDKENIQKRYVDALTRFFKPLQDDPRDLVALKKFADLLAFADLLPFTVEFGQLQNIFSFWINHGYLFDDPTWHDLVDIVAKRLRVRVPA